MVKSLGKAKKDVVIVGPWQQIAALVDSAPNIRLMGLLSEILVMGEYDGRMKVTGQLDDLPKMIEEWNAYCVVSLMHKMEKNTRKDYWKWFAEKDIPTKKFINVIHHNTNIPTRWIDIGDGCIIHPFVSISENVTLHENVILEPGVFIRPGVEIGRFTIVESGALISEAATIGSAVCIGAHVTIDPFVRIGSFVDIPPNTHIIKDII